MEPKWSWRIPRRGTRPKLKPAEATGERTELPQEDTDIFEESVEEEQLEVLMIPRNVEPILHYAASVVKFEKDEDVKKTSERASEKSVNKDSEYFQEWAQGHMDSQRTTGDIPYEDAEDFPEKKRTSLVWGTSQMSRNTHRELFMYRAIKEFFIFLIFLTLVSIVAFRMVTPTMYYYNFVVSDVLTKSKFNITDGNGTQAITSTFREIRTIQHFWAFLKTVFIDTIFFQHFEDEQSKMTLTMEEQKLFLFENVLVGVPRIRQVRVRNDTCKVPQNFDIVFKSCFSYYSRANEDREPFGLKNGTEWRFEADIASSHAGLVSTYGRGGYYLNLTRNYEFTKKSVEVLYQNLWVDHGTRAVFLDFTVYTPNENLFFNTMLVVEFPPSGGAVPSSHFHILRLLRYVTFWDFFVLGCEVVVVLFVLFYTFEEIMEMNYFKWDYLQSPWNYLDLTIILLGWTTALLLLHRYIMVRWELPELIQMIDTDDYANFDDLRERQQGFEVILALFAFFVWLKVLKFAMLTRTIYHILVTVSKCTYELMGLSFVLLILLTAFALLGHLIFGAQVAEFGTTWESMVSLVVIIVGSLDYKKLQEVRPILGTLYFVIFIFFFMLIFISLFVAIIVNGFAMVRYDIMEDRHKVFLKNILERLLMKLLKALGMVQLAEKMQKRMEVELMKEDFDVATDVLRRSGFRGNEVPMFLKKHGIEEGKPISDAQMQSVYDDIDNKGQLYLEALEHEQIMEQVEMLRLRMHYADSVTEELVAKVDLLLQKAMKAEPEK